MRLVHPDAVLINNTANPVDIIYLAATRCYSKDKYTENNDDLFLASLTGVTTEDKINLIKKCIKAGHDSVLEHAYITFHITCSRACSHQLVRHRLANFAQSSQRYITYDNISFISKSDENNEEQLEIYKKAEEAYKSLIDNKMPAEDARMVLPNAVATHLVVTMNVRELRHFFSLRCCNKAQWEIREIAWKMLTLCKEKYSALFEDTGPKCFFMKRCTEFKPCKEQPYRTVKF
jgi:thymidylate synthase (FAD)